MRAGQRRAAILTLVGALLMHSGSASAEVVSANSNGFHLRHSVQLVVPTSNAWDSFLRVGDWWDDEHTYSGDGANMNLAAAPGGCLCERVPAGGGIEHMRVAYVDPGKRLVMTGSLGPLLYEATAAVMDVQVERIAGGAKITMEYKAAGFATGGADKMAPLVDGVLGEQMRRYRTYAAAQARAR